MRNKIHAVFLLGLFIVMGFVLACSLTGLFKASKLSYQLQETSIQNIKGLDMLEAKASGSVLPLSTFSFYDQAHGTSLYNLAIKLTPVATSQTVTSSDFEKLRSLVEKEIENQSEKESGWESFIRIVATVFIAPIWTKFLTNITDDYIYPFYRETIKKLFNRNKKEYEQGEK